MIVICGATGKLGGSVVRQLIDRRPTATVTACVRDPEKCRDLRELGVVIRQADYDDRESLERSFEGAAKVLIVSAPNTGEKALHQHQNAIRSALAAGARRIFYTSHMGANPGSLFWPMPDHAATEALLAEMQHPYTSLRNGFYAASAMMLASQALATGEIAAPEDGPVSWTTHDDLAEAAARLMLEDMYDGPTPPLTASEALDLEDIARIMSEVSGTPIRRVTISDAQYRANLLQHGLPEHMAGLLVSMFEASRNGEFAATDPALEGLLCRPPKSMETVIGEMLARPVDPAREGRN